MRTTYFILTAAISAGFVSSGAAIADIPPHPDKITFEALKFDPPVAKEFRHTLSNGVVVYMAPSAEFPLINLGFTFRGGAYLDPKDKIGLADFTGSMMRSGGTTTLKPADLDEEIDFLAAQINAGCGDTTSSASLNCLKSNFEQSFKLFMDVVRNPGFDKERLDVYRSKVLEGLKQRNDDAGPILDREWNSLLYGADHFEAAQPTKAGVESITIDDMKAMHARIFHPGAGNLYIAVTGDFDPQSMLSTLQSAFDGWKAGEANPTPPAPTTEFKPGVYYVEKDIPQGKVFIGMRGIKRDDPDAIPVSIMNQILGGGGFTSRITNRVRSDEGLAYSAGSAMQPNVWYPGEFRALFQSKNTTCALATKIVMEEIGRIRAEPVTAEELDVAKKSFIETFPRTFESKPGMLGVFVNDEMTNRPADYWQTFRKKVQAVTPTDVQAAAKKHLSPENMAIFVVGKWDEIYRGDIDGRANMSEFFGGNATEVPLKDPLTLQPISK